jgi:dihydrofolate synthase/folylpolyglutamate synthase
MAPLPTTLDDWLDYQQRQSPRSIDLGLERVRDVADRAALAAPPYPSILVGGTNGKGSTVALLAALARSLGLRAGTFTSPHLVRYNERIAIDGVPVEDAVLVGAFGRIETARRAVPLTFFEYNTLAAWDVFERANLDLAIVEVGLGGRLDATNALAPDVAVLCSVGLDHRDWLGATREQIGAEKAGIFRAGRPAILGSADMPLSVHAALARVGALPRWAGRDFSAEVDAGQGPSAPWTCAGWSWRLPDLPAPALPGAIQYGNAATAIAAFTALAETRAPAWLARLDAAHVATALRSVALPGRFQVVPGAPEWILDVAHNEPAAQVLAAELAARPCAGRTLAVAGMLADKDIEAIGAALADSIDAWVLCSLEGPRATDAHELRRRLPAACRSLALAADVPGGCSIARAAARPEDRIVVLGSFHTVGPALEWLRIY